MTQHRSPPTQSDYLQRVTLTGNHVTLVPLGREHDGALFTALNHDEELWRYIPVRQPATRAEMGEWIETALSEQRQGIRIPFAVIDNASLRAIGSTSYVFMSAENRHLDIGWTWYGREYWRTAVNTECKYMMLRRAFDELGCIRVQLRVDLRNLRSQRAVERIGGVRDGVLRKAQILHDGHQRSVVIYSILDEEWPARKVWFEERLGI